MFKSNTLPFGKKIVASIAAVTLVAGCVPMVGLQSSGQEAYATSLSPTGYVTASAYRAAESSPEILGITGVETNNAWSTGTSVLNWGAPNYYIMGTTRNVNPNAYIFNAVQVNTGADTAASPTIIAVPNGARNGGPTGAMLPYGTSGQTESDAAWEQLPDIIVGTGARTNTYDANMYTTGDYATPLANLRTKTGNANYTPVAVGYNSTNIYTMMTTMYDMAGKADTIVANSNNTKKLRYSESATTIATKFELFVKGIQGKVLQGLAADGKSKKTVVNLVGYDNTTSKFLCIQSGATEGTATQNRLLEATQNVATNVGDDTSHGTQAVTWKDKDGKTTDPVTYTTLTKDELASVDLIMIGSQAAGGSSDTVQTDDSKILAAMDSNMVAKTYWVDSSNGSAGSLYGVTMNSVENGQNTARILGMLYPEYVNQSNLIAYYYQNFYHVSNDQLADTIDNAMDLVRNAKVTTTSSSNNYSAYLQWSASDIAGYNESSVYNSLLEGTQYLINNEASVPALLAVTDTGKAYVTKYSDTTNNFANRLYTEILGREGDAQGFADQVNALKAGQAPSEIAYNFFNSPEYYLKAEDPSTTIERVYQVMFGRASDTGGKAFWLAKMNDGMSVRAIVAGFSESQEYKTYYTSCGLNAATIPVFASGADQAWDSAGNVIYAGPNYRDNNQGMAGFCSRMYTKCLNRTYETKGLNDQCLGMQNGIVCWEIARNYFCSTEFASFNLSASDQVTRCYEAILGRAPESQDAINYWTSRLQNEGMESIVKGFCESNEFEAICQTYGMTSGMR